jgi:CDP-glucose 4,6-dehydratase
VGDFFTNRVLPGHTHALQKNDIIILRNPLSRQPWQHVLKPLLNYIPLADRLPNDP